MKKLIIAEKPKVARSIVAAIGRNSFSSKDGYYENDNYIVTNAFGHLFSLQDLEEYDKDYDSKKKYKWKLDNIPFFPVDFKFKLATDPKTGKADDGVKKQVKVISDLCKRADVESVVNAGDSDREGEIIVRIILNSVKNKKPVERMWLPDQTSKTILKALKTLKPDAEYDSLANEGFARTYVDWLYGINLTRYATLKSGKLLRVGRVTSPIVNAIYERDNEIENFVPQKYFVAISKEQTKGELITLQSKHEFKPDKIQDGYRLCHTYNAAPTRVVDNKKERKIIPAGKLYSLSKLQGVAGKQFKLSPSDTLSIVQSLYEKGYVTYPRTNTEYLAVAEKDNVKDIIDRINSQYQLPVKFKDEKTIFDDSKIESHSAITPTTQLPMIAALNPNEQKIYNTILNRFVAVFCAEDCEVDRSTIVIDNGYEKFTLSGDVMIKRGWTQYDINSRKDEVLPNLVVGDLINVKFELVEKETNPPKHYTVDSFLKFLQNPFKNEKAKDLVDDESDEEDYKAIMSGAELGTEATRAGLIDSAIRNEYIKLENNTYYITDLGKFYVNTLKSLFIDMTKNKTVQLGVNLKKVYKGELSIQNVLYLASQEILETFSHKDEIKTAKYYEAAKDLCKCPKCGCMISETFKTFTCVNPSCKMSLYKDDKYFAAFSKKIDAKIAKSLLETGKVHVTGLVSSKSKMKFNGTISADFSGEFPKYTLEFDEQQNKEVIGKCPKCGQDVVESFKTFNCSNSNCKFVMFKQDNYLKAFGKQLTKTIAKSFLSEGKAVIKGMKSKNSGNKFDAVVAVDYSEQYPKYQLEFLNTLE